MVDRNITGNVILVGKVCDMRLSGCRPSEDVGWLVLSGIGEGGEGRGGEGVPGRSRFHLQQAVPGVSPGHHTPPSPPPPPPVLFLQHNLISYIQQEFLRKISTPTSDGEISPEIQSPVTTGTERFIRVHCGDPGQARGQPD